MYNNLRDYLKTNSIQIILEGVDRVGKTTLIKNLEQYLYINFRNEFTPYLLKQPYSETIARIFADTNNALDQLNLMIADTILLNQNIDSVLKSHDESGVIVLQDRHAYFSAQAYQVVNLPSALREDARMYLKNSVGNGMFNTSVVFIATNTPFPQDRKEMFDENKRIIASQVYNDLLDRKCFSFIVVPIEIGDTYDDIHYILGKVDELCRIPF